MKYKSKLNMHNTLLLFACITSIEVGYTTSTKNYSKNMGINLSSDTRTVSIRMINCTGREINVDNLGIPGVQKAITKFLRGYGIMGITHQFLSAKLEEVKNVDHASTFTIPYTYKDFIDDNKEHKGDFYIEPGKLSFDWYANTDEVKFRVSSGSNITAEVTLSLQRSDNKGDIAIKNCASEVSDEANQQCTSIPEQLGSYPRIIINPELSPEGESSDNIPEECGDVQPRKHIELPMATHLSPNNIYVGDKVEFKFPFASGKRMNLVCSYRWQKDNSNQVINCNGADDENIAMQFDQTGQQIHAYCIGKNCSKLIH